MAIEIDPEVIQDLDLIDAVDPDDPIFGVDDPPAVGPDVDPTDTGGGSVQPDDGNRILAPELPVGHPEGRPFLPYPSPYKPGGPNGPPTAAFDSNEHGSPLGRGSFWDKNVADRGASVHIQIVVETRVG